MPPEPVRSAGRLWSAVSRIIALPAVSQTAMRMATVVDRPLLRLTRGRIRLSFVIPCLLLRVRGARSGCLREVPLLYVPDGDDVLLVGSGGGGRREPAWCANLRANPEVQTVRRGRIERRIAAELSGHERASAWRLAVNVYPGYQHYQERLSGSAPCSSRDGAPAGAASTGAGIAREIPVFRLRPVASEQTQPEAH